MSKTKKIVLLFIHMFITVSTIILTINGVFFGAGKGQLGENMINIGYFKAFTMDSNDLSALASLFMCIYLILSLKKNEDDIPYWVILLQYFFATAVGLTFLTTATFLGSIQISRGKNYFELFSGDMFFMHFLNPMLAMGSFIFGSKQYVFGKKENLLSLIPVSIYTIVYFTNVVILKTWDDFYCFTFNGRNWVTGPVLIIIFSVTFLIGRLLILCKKAVNKKSSS